MLFREEFWKKGKLARLGFIARLRSRRPRVLDARATARADDGRVGRWASRCRLSRCSASTSAAIARSRRPRARSVSRARSSRRLLVDSWTHNWEDDPFSRGAYSYPLVGGWKAGEMLTRPIRGTLYIAGEATVKEADSGTVHGAIRSGQRAAKQVARRLGVSA